MTVHSTHNCVDAELDILGYLENINVLICAAIWRGVTSRYLCTNEQYMSGFLLRLAEEQLEAAVVNNTRVPLYIVGQG